MFRGSRRFVRLSSIAVLLALAFALLANATAHGDTTVASLIVGPASSELSAIAFDSTNGNLYVVDSNSGVPGTYSSNLPGVYVISGSTNRVVATIDAGPSPGGIAFDSANGDIYVANSGSDTVSVVSGSTDTLVTNVNVGKSPYGIAVDPSNGDVYVANAGSNSTSVISGSTNRQVATVTVGATPLAAAFDSSNGDVYVANRDSGTVSVISGSTQTLVATLTVGSIPEGLAFDSANGDIYVANRNSNSVSVISGSTNTVVATLLVGPEPDGVAFDPADGSIYVANLLSSKLDNSTGSVSVISGLNGTVLTRVLVGYAPLALAFDSTNGEIYVANNGSGYGPSSVSVIGPGEPALGCAQCWLQVGPAVFARLGPYQSVQVTYNNGIGGNVTGIVFAVVHNSLGQTVEISTATLQLQAGANGTAYPVLFGLPSGQYSTTIFAIESSGIAISTTTTLTFTQS